MNFQALARSAESETGGGSNVCSSRVSGGLPTARSGRIAGFGNVAPFPAKPVIGREAPPCIVSPGSHRFNSKVDALLEGVSVDIEAFAVCEIGEGVRLVIPPAKMIEVHYVLEGTLHLTIDGTETFKAGPGTMLIVPPDRLQHLATSSDGVLSKSPDDICPPVREGTVVVGRTDGQQPALRVACGAVMPDALGSFGPLKNLTRPVVEDLSDYPVVAAAFATLLKDMASPREGTRAMMSALMKSCLVVLLRRHIERSRHTGSAPAVFHDPRLSRAITSVRNLPAAPHCLASLAKEAGMSRSAFAREFKAALNMTPMEFVAQVRLDLAHRFLETTGMGIEGIATAVGFSSRSHFSHLFREHYGTDPSSFRRGNMRRAAS